MKKGLHTTVTARTLLAPPLSWGIVHHPEAPAFQELGESPFLLLPVSSTLAALIWGGTYHPCR